LRGDFTLQRTAQGTTARISAPELSAQWFHRSEIASD
jgi:hypothetical protein